jgi:hypothetical protein
MTYTSQRTTCTEANHTGLLILEKGISYMSKRKLPTRSIGNRRRSERRCRCTVSNIALEVLPGQLRVIVTGKNVKKAFAFNMQAILRDKSVLKTDLAWPPRLHGGRPPERCHCLHSPCAIWVKRIRTPFCIFMVLETPFCRASMCVTMRTVENFPHLSMILRKSESS